MSTKAAALIDGAMKGYNFVDGIYRRDQQDEERQEDRRIAAEDRKLRLGYQEEDRKIAAEDRKVAMQDRERNIKRQETQDGYAQYSHEQQKKNVERLDTRLDAAAMLEKFKNPEYKATKEDHAFIKKLATEIESNGDDGVKYNLQKLSTGVQSYLSGENKGAINSPEFIGAFNKVFERKINRNYGVGVSPVHDPDGTVVKKEVDKIMPGKKPGTVVIQLKVTAKDKDGKVYQYTAPATEDRGSGDIVSQIPVEQVLGDIGARLSLTDDNHRKQMITHLRSLVVRGGGKPEEQYSDPEKLGAGYIQRDSNNKAHGIPNTLGRGGRGGGSAPADLQMIEYYVREHKMSQEDARRLVNSKNSTSLEDLAGQIYTAKIKAAGNMVDPAEKAQWLEQSKMEAAKIKGTYKEPEPSGEQGASNTRAEGQDANSWVLQQLGGQ